MKNIKNTITNIAALLVILGAAVSTYVESLGGGEINWLNLGLALAVAVIGWLTGKGTDARST